jgi:1-acyl-sn-glycerol-3-phosphate acyltransferase
LIPASKNRWFEAFFAHHARGRIAKQFSEVRAFRASETAAIARETPLLLVSNHTAWWDPLFAIWLSNYILGVDGHAMMDAANLRRLPFFGKVGAFGVDLTDPADGARALRYAIKLLGRSPTSHAPAASRMVWIYAQGAERPITEPLVFRPGAAEIASLAKNAAVVPVGLRYEFSRSEAPVACLSFGEPLVRDGAKGRVTTGSLEAAVSGELARIDGALRDGSFFGDGATWAPLHIAAPSRIGMLAERLLAWLTGPSVRALPAP